MYVSCCEEKFVFSLFSNLLVAIVNDCHDSGGWCFKCHRTINKTVTKAIAKDVKIGNNYIVEESCPWKGKEKEEGKL